MRTYDGCHSCWAESVQAAVYKLSETGQAIDNGDLNSATLVLATEWINNVKAAVSKVWMAFPAF